MRGPEQEASATKSPGRRAARWGLAALLLVGFGAGMGAGGTGVETPPAGAAAEAEAAPERHGGDDSLRELLAAAPGDTTAHEEIVALVEEASEALDDDRPRDALPLYDSVAAMAPALRDWIPLFKAEAAAEAGEPGETDRFLHEVPVGPGLRDEWGWRFHVRALEVAGDTVAAAEEALRAAEGRSGSADRAGMRHRAAALFADAADTARALEAAWQAVEEAPASGAGGRAARLVHDFSAPRGDRAVRLAEVLLSHAEWEDAWELLEDHALAETNPGSGGLAPDLRADLGRGLVQIDRHQRALELLEALDSEGTPGEVRARALYWSARALEGRNREAEAEEVLRRVAELDPGLRVAGRARLQLAERAADEGDVEEASRHLEALVSSGHRTATSDLLAVRLGSRSYLAGSYDEAVEILGAYAEAAGNRSVPGKVRHWQAMVLDGMGQSDRADEILRDVYDRDPFSFQGVVAAHRLDLPLLYPDMALGPPEREDLDTELANALLRLQVHRHVPTAGSFAFELDRIRNHFLELGDGAAYELAEALIRHDLSIQGILLGRELHRRAGEWDLRLLRIVYPFPNRGEVVRQAHEQNLDPFLVAGLIRQESMFRADIRSPAGAVGLMQLMPGTARQVAREKGIGGTMSSERLEDPGLNLRLGTYFLRQMLDRFDGSVTDALAAYNAGPTNARRWQGIEEYSDVRVFVPHIPFRETRHYVRIVQQNARIYAALYGCGDFESCPGLSYTEWVERTSPLVRPPTAIPAR